jgi:dGTPase
MQDSVDVCFHHELHSLRVVDHLESPYRDYGQTGHVGLNLTFAVRDGIACHQGEEIKRRLRPNSHKRPEDLGRVAYGDPPATLEGCVVRFADKVAYLGRDLQDAEAEGIVSRDEFHKEVKDVLGTDNRDIIGRLVKDIYEQSRDPDFVGISEGVHDALVAFNDFNVKAIYRNERVVHPFARIDRAIQPLYDQLAKLTCSAQRRRNLQELRQAAKRETKYRRGLVEELECHYVLAQFLEEDVVNWMGAAPGTPPPDPRQLAADFIAGMTDNYFARCFDQLFRPRPTV